MPQYRNAVDIPASGDANVDTSGIAISRGSATLRARAREFPRRGKHDVDPLAGIIRPPPPCPSAFSRCLLVVIFRLRGGKRSERAGARPSFAAREV